MKLLVPLLFSVFCSVKDGLVEAKTQKSYHERALDILSETPLIDGHNDLAFLVRLAYQNHIYGHNFTDSFEHGGFSGHYDIKRARDGKYGGAFWSAFWLCPSNISDFSDEAYHPGTFFLFSHVQTHT